MNEPVEVQIEAMLDILNRHAVAYVLIGGYAAIFHGAAYVTFDVDICPARERQNLARLASALIELDARIRTQGEPSGLTFDRSASFLGRVEILNLVTRFGFLDVAFQPLGTGGYEDLRRHAVTYNLGDLRAPVASLADVVRSKEAANRNKDRLVLPTLRELLSRSQFQE